MYGNTKINLGIVFRVFPAFQMKYLAVSSKANLYFCRHEISQHAYISSDLTNNDERDEEGYYKCRGPDCFLLYKAKASRNRQAGE